MNATVTRIIAEIFLSGNCMPGILCVLSLSRLKTTQWVRCTHDHLHFTDEKTEAKVTTTSGWMVKLDSLWGEWLQSSCSSLSVFYSTEMENPEAETSPPRASALAPVIVSLASGSFSLSLRLLQEGFRHQASFLHQHHPILPATYSLIPFSHGDTRLWQSPSNGSNYGKKNTAHKYILIISIFIYLIKIYWTLPYISYILGTWGLGIQW